MSVVERALACNNEAAWVDLAALVVMMVVVLASLGILAWGGRR